MSVVFRLALAGLFASSAAAFAADGPAAPPTTVVPAAAPAPMPAAPTEKMICRRELDTGSFVKGTRRCMTAAQWRQSSEDAQAKTRDMQTLGANSLNH